MECAAASSSLPDVSSAFFCSTDYRRARLRGFSVDLCISVLHFLCFFFFIRPFENTKEVPHDLFAWLEERPTQRLARNAFIFPPRHHAPRRSRRGTPRKARTLVAAGHHNRRVRVLAGIRAGANRPGSLGRRRGDDPKIAMGR